MLIIHLSALHRQYNFNIIDVFRQIHYFIQKYEPEIGNIIELTSFIYKRKKV